VTGEPQVVGTDTDAFAWDAERNPLPPSVDVAIIGGGIVGCSAAYYLARGGVSAAVFEKGRIAGEQSGRNWGWVRQQCRSPVELPLMMQSIERWKALPGELGEDIGFRQGGTLYLAEDGAQLEELAAWLPVAREHGLESRLVVGSELGAVLVSDDRWAGAIYTPSDGRAEPSRVAPAIARGAKRAGARVFTHCAVRGLDVAAGRAAGVVTEQGRVSARSVVCAAGVWSRLFCGSFGVAVPQLPVLNSVARTAPAPQLLEGQAWSPAVAIRRRADGGYTVAHGGSSLHSIVPASFRYLFKYLPALRAGGDTMRVGFGKDFFRALATPSRWALDSESPFERERVLNPQPEARVLGQIRQGLARWHPGIAEVPIVETWAGMIEASPDVLPIISTVPGIEGFLVATGFSGHGFGIGPGAGRLVADLVTGRADSEAAKSFRLSRFFDGSPIVPGPAI